jgi:hypothetical protein
MFEMTIHSFFFLRLKKGDLTEELEVENRLLHQNLYDSRGNIITDNKTNEYLFYSF